MIFNCTYFSFIKAPNKLSKSFLSALIRLYLNYFFSLLNEVCLKETQHIFFRQQIWVFASGLMYDFCLHVNIDYFNKLFQSIIFSEAYTVTCYRILNKHSVAGRILGEHRVIDLTES